MQPNHSPCSLSLPSGEAGQSWTILVFHPTSTTSLLCDFEQVTLPL